MCWLFSHSRWKRDFVSFYWGVVCRLSTLSLSLNVLRDYIRSFDFSKKKSSSKCPHLNRIVCRRSRRLKSWESEKNINFSHRLTLNWRMWKKNPKMISLLAARVYDWRKTIFTCHRKLLSRVRGGTRGEWENWNIMVMGSIFVFFVVRPLSRLLPAFMSLLETPM